MLEEEVEILVQSLHQITADDDSIVIDKGEVCDNITVLIDKYEGEGAQKIEIFVKPGAHTVDNAADDRLNFLVEIVRRMADPFFDNAPSEFDIVVVMYQYLATILFDLQVDIRQGWLVVKSGTLGGSLADGAFNLFERLFSSVHRDLCCCIRRKINIRVRECQTFGRISCNNVCFFEKKT